VAALDPNQFTTHHAEVRNGVSLAYVHEGVGGFPVVLLHGYPETKRIWWRNIAPLATAGFEVIAPDLRGHGDSTLAADGFYDIAAFAKDIYALVHDHLGHERCAVVGGDVGGVVLFDLGLRYPGWVTRQVLFNTLPPPLDAVYAQAGLAPDPPHELRATADYFVRQGREADALLAELDTPRRRRDWVGAMYRQRLWASPGTFDVEAIAFMTEPYADPDKLRASWGVYEGASGTRPFEELPCLFERTPVPTLLLYGPDDHVVPTSFPDKAAAACEHVVGPVHIPRAGHFLQWEQADTFNGLVIAYLDALLVSNSLPSTRRDS
jgi:pimeloyl-ACP methyl ester carboxylesterase